MLAAVLVRCRAYVTYAGMWFVPADCRMHLNLGWTQYYCGAICSRLYLCYLYCVQSQRGLDLDFVCPVPTERWSVRAVVEVAHSAAALYCGSGFGFCCNCDFGCEMLAVRVAV